MLNHFLSPFFLTVSSAGFFLQALLVNGKLLIDGFYVSLHLFGWNTT